VGTSAGNRHFGRRRWKVNINPLNAELNPICHLLELLGAHHILHLSGLRVNMDCVEIGVDGLSWIELVHDTDTYERMNAAMNIWNP